MSKDCCVEKCDIFDFMAYHVGMSVLHPGGFVATRKLIEACKINKNTKIIDIACGKGSTSIYLAEKYGCSVIGVDISETLIDQARKNAKKKGLTGLINFQVADALNLPFGDAEFDVAISQAMLVLIEDKKKAVQEAMRVIKTNGYAGWLELSWQKQPTQEFLDILSNEICAYCMLNVSTFDGWESLFQEAGVKQLDIIKFRNSPNSTFGNMFAEEGLTNSLKIMSKYISNSTIRKRMQKLDRFFKANQDSFGYGIYIAKK